MINSIINRSDSFIRGLIPKTIGKAVSRLSPYLGGLPAAIASFASYLNVRKYLNRSIVPVKPLPRIIWKQNSCFLSSAMWSFFLNEPLVLKELSAAIQRRLSVKDLFPKTIDRLLLGPIAPKKGTALLEAGFILGSGAKNLPDLCKHLKVLADGGYPQGVNGRAVNELITLLELQSLIQECQTGQPVDGDRINTLREMVKRVDPTFRDVGNRTGDASEVIGILADLIFHGSSALYTQHKIRNCWAPNYKLCPYAQEGEERNPLTGILNDGRGVETNPETGEIKSRERGWGRFELPFTPKGVVSQILENHLAEDTYEASYLADDYQKRPFQVRESNLLTRPPELLVLTLRRYEDIGGVMDVEETLELPSTHFLNGEAGRYQLTGVSRRLESYAHYDAYVKRPDGAYTYCDDYNKRCDRCSREDFLKAAQTGYVLIYRKVAVNS